MANFAPLARSTPTLLRYLRLRQHTDVEAKFAEFQLRVSGVFHAGIAMICRNRPKSRKNSLEAVLPALCTLDRPKHFGTPLLC